jgi:hypothetical protein
VSVDTNLVDIDRIQVTNRVLTEVMREREAQYEKWGEQNHPNGTGRPASKEIADAARAITDRKAKLGTLTYLDILREEFFEAAAEGDADSLRKELIQVAAVAVAWVEAIDRKKDAK